MRRIYKPNNVTTSDDYVLLDDPFNEEFIEEEDTEEALDDKDEDECEAQGDENGESESSDAAPRPEMSTAGKRSSHRRTTNTMAQDMAQLQELRDQIIAQAASESARVIEEGHARAQSEYQSAINRAAKQIENDREAARQLGRKEAFAQYAQAITTCVNNIEAAVARIEGAQAGFITGYESDLKWMALEIAQKILMDTITVDETRLVPLVMAAVNSVKSSQWMSVEISENMTQLLTRLQKELQDDSFAGRVGLKLVAAPPDTCIIETPDKFFDASITQQIENLKGYFAAEQG